MDEEKDTQSDYSSENDKDTESSYNQSTEEDEDTQSDSIQSSEEEEDVEEDVEEDEEEEKNIEETDKRCPLSHPGDPHTLSRINGDICPPDSCYTCGEKKNFPHNENYYRCATCDASFHSCCYYQPSKLLHPYHPQHPLTFVYQSSTLGPELGHIFDYHTKANVSGNMSRSQPLITFDECSWCTRSIRGREFYLCLICNFCLDPYCVRKFPPLTIANPKSHHHSLVLFSRPLLVPCDACGFIERKEPTYACFQCNYMVHQSCIDLPRVIKITRHPHRLSHTPYPPPITTSCRVCYKSVDIKYGQYSCSEEDCTYVVHSKCATREQIWDGKELEWEPEQADEDNASFKKVGPDLIAHFAHEHHLRLEKYDRVRDAEKQCQACTRLIDSRDFYNCLECEFFFHEVCAGLPRKLEHAMHRHPLVLETSPKGEYLKMICSTCYRMSSGFSYRCAVDCGFKQLEFCCIFVPEYFTHKSHEHPLFISTRDSQGDICCTVCKRRCWSIDLLLLQCTQCEFAMCYTCVTIPDQLCCKYDEHPLSLCYEYSKDEIYWCEVCEKKVDTKTWFYTCNKCCTTIHHLCVFDYSAYMKCGSTVSCHGVKGEIVRNSSQTRFICSLCGQRCPGYIYIKFPKSTFCSITCLADAGLRNPKIWGWKY